jgi:uncharacterized protein (DUF427 family)
MEIVRIEPAPKWIRGRIGDRIVVDTRRAQLVWEHEYYPWWYIPAEDVADDSLLTTSIEQLPDHVKVDWSAVERWFEEDEEVFIHPRDPYRRVDALPSSRHVVVRVGGVIVADSHRPTVLYETGLPPRYYLPPDDVRLDLLNPTETTTGCPYKGFARYWSLTVGETEYPDLVWGYDDPLPESAPVRGLMCFYNDRVDLEIDGATADRSSS